MHEVNKWPPFTIELQRNNWNQTCTSRAGNGRGEIIKFKLPLWWYKLALSPQEKLIRYMHLDEQIIVKKISISEWMHGFIKCLALRWTKLWLNEQGFIED